MSDEHHLKIKDLAEQDRPREKMISKGSVALSESELLGILIGSGVENLTAVDVARNVLSKYHDNLNELGKATIADLKKIKGIGEARAVNILAALELGKRRNFSEALERPSIKVASDAVDIIHPVMSDLLSEEVWALFLNTANRVLAIRQISKGGLSSSCIDVRVVMKMALDVSATNFIIAHNHPSGNLQPSRQDMSVTRNLKDAGNIMEIRMLDHIIVCANKDKFYSFQEHGLL